MNNTKKLYLGLAVFALAYGVLSMPECQKACRSLMEPLAGEGGKLMASAVVGILIAGL